MMPKTPEENQKVQTSQSTASIPCLILCAGTSRRFGSDKILADLDGRPVLSHAIERLSADGCELALNVDPLQNPEYVRFNLPLLADVDLPIEQGRDDHGKLGPLIGVYTALIWAERDGHSHVLTWPGDTPFVPLGFSTKMQIKNKQAIAVAQTGTDKHYVCGLWPTALRPVLYAALMDGERSIRRFLAHFHDGQGHNQGQNQGRSVVWVNFETQNAQDGFFNINTKEDLKNAHTILVD